jgi:methionyl-tRNA formyltransferase
MQPWPTADTYFHRPGKPPVRVIITRAIPGGIAAFGLGPSGPVAGKMFVRSGSPLELIVWAGKEHPGGVRVLELQPAGKRRMTATEFLRGHPLQEGDYFGPETP